MAGLNPSTNLFQALSQAIVEAVNQASVSTLTVIGRRRMPASGIALTSDLILTADHVVERDDELLISLPDGSQHAAILAGRDQSTDLAVLRLASPALTVTRLAQDEPRIGQLVVALGRPSSEGIQASLGMVSAIVGPIRTGRGGLLERVLRTDANPYPGFSGGPLIDTGGDILGINTSGFSGGELLTIPASLAWNIGRAIAQYGRVKRGFLGIRSQPVQLPAAQQQTLGRSQQVGLLIVGVEDDGPAAKGGLLVGDILVGLGGKPVLDPDDLLVHLVGSNVGNEISVEVIRGGQVKVVTVTIGERK
jgi:S1-C subfamily serine protease